MRFFEQQIEESDTKTERSQKKVRRGKKTGVLDIVPWPWFSSNKFKLILTSSEINNITDDEETDDEPGISSGSKRVRGKERKKRQKKRKKRNKKTDNKASGLKLKPEKSQEREEEAVTEMLSVNLNPKPSRYNVTNYLRWFKFFLWKLTLPKKIDPSQTDFTCLFIFQLPADEELFTPSIVPFIIKFIGKDTPPGESSP